MERDFLSRGKTDCQCASLQWLPALPSIRSPLVLGRLRIGPPESVPARTGRVGTRTYRRLLRRLQFPEHPGDPGTMNLRSVFLALAAPLLFMIDRKSVV